MNYWRLLLLAVVAVFQPIASFTERNLVNGRQQCCDRLSSAPLRDTRSSLDGIYRLEKSPSAVQRLNDRVEIREDQRHELRQREAIFSRRSTEKRVGDTRETAARKGPSGLTRSSQAEYRLESNGRRLHIRVRENTINNQDLKLQDFSRVVISRSSRDALEHRNNRINDDYRTGHYRSERLYKNLIDSRRDIQKEQFRNGELRFIADRNARRGLRQTKDEASGIEAYYMNNRQRFGRERLNVVRRESLVRANIDNNNERRVQEGSIQQRRSLSENTRLVDPIRDMRMRLNSKEDNRVNELRISKNQRLSPDRFVENREQRDHSRKSQLQNNENTDRRTSDERAQMTQKITRASRIMKAHHNHRDVEDRQEIGRKNRMTRDIRDEVRENSDRGLSRERTQIDQRNTYESRLIRTQNVRSVEGRRERRHSGKMAQETRDEISEDLENRMFRVRIQMHRRETRESRNTFSHTEKDPDNREINLNGKKSRISRIARESYRDKVSRERMQMDRRNFQDLRVLANSAARDDKSIDSTREMRNNARVSRVTREQNRVNPDKLSLERIEIETRAIRESSRRDTRNNERFIDARGSIEERMSLDRIHSSRRDIRESGNEREVRNLRDVTYNIRSPATNRKNPAIRLAFDRTQIDREHTLRERHLDSRQEMRHNERMPRDTRDEIRGNSNRRITRESRRVSQRDVRESTTANIISARNEREQRELRFNDRLSGQVRVDKFTAERRFRMESRQTSRAAERDNLMIDQRARSADRRDFREIRAEPRLSRSHTQTRNEFYPKRNEYSYNIENTEHEVIDARFRNTEQSRNRERTSTMMAQKMNTENDSIVANWQYVLYTMQGAYLCAFFMHMLMPSHPGKSHKMNLGWLPISSNYNPIKVD